MTELFSTKFAIPRLPVCGRFIFAFLFVPAIAMGQSAPPDSDWQANATLESRRSMTIEGLGAAQGVSLHNGKIYLYGDVHSAKPRVGVIREYDNDLQPTGKTIWLRKEGRPLLFHPTGLSWDERNGCVLGDTVNKKAVIYRLNWELALKEGNLDHAVEDTLQDDVAVNGCRPIFVSVGNRKMLATADYGDVRPMIRLCDIDKLFAARRTSAPGVVVHQILCGPFNQNLAWDEEKRQLTCIQNVVAGLGWQLDTLDLEKAIVDGRADGPGVRIQKMTFGPHSELEGFFPLAGGRGIFVTSYEKNNVTIGKIMPASFLTPKGNESFHSRD